MSTITSVKKLLCIIVILDFIAVAAQLTYTYATGNDQYSQYQKSARKINCQGSKCTHIRARAMSKFAKEEMINE